MSLILAIENSTELCSVALAHGESMTADILSCHEFAGQRSSARLLPMVRELLAQAGLTLSDCDAIAFGAGPGAFTGLRSACGVAQGLAWGADLPVISVSSLEACADQVRDLLPADSEVCPDVIVAIDARMDEVYWARYRLSAPDADWQILGEMQVDDPQSLLDQIGGRPSARPFWLVGNAAKIFGERLSLATHADRVFAEIQPHARTVAGLALRAWAAGKMLAAEDAMPIYIRNKVALTTVEREQMALNKVQMVPAQTLRSDG